MSRGRLFDPDPLTRGLKVLYDIGIKVKCVNGNKYIIYYV